MKFEFPDTGEGVTEGQFLEWNVEEGEKVEEDQVVGEAETDKAVVDIPAPADGTVKELKASPGDKVHVGDVIMILGTGGGETSSDKEPEESAKPEQKESGSESEEPVSERSTDAIMGGAPSASSYDDEEEPDTGDRAEKSSEAEKNDEASGEVLALPKVRKLAEEKGVDLASLDIDGRITEEDVMEASKTESSHEISEENHEERETVTEPDTDGNSAQDMSDVNARPSVRKLAREHDIEISVLDGTGRDGEVTREDVLAAAGEDEPEPEPEASDSSESSKIETERDIERVEMSGVRKATADKMVESRFSAPHVTHIEKADITELVELREAVKSEVEAHLTYLPFIMKACVAGLKEHPLLNSELDEENDEIIQKNFYDFNIAVDTDRGLLVPKIEDVDEKNMVELAADIGDKAERAQNNDLDREDMAPGSFSITNLGVIGGEAFTPIIYPPQSAILGVGKIQETAEVVDGEVVPRKTVKLSLSYDHRVIDGAEAARFMNKVVKDLENPRNLILDI